MRNILSVFLLLWATLTSGQTPDTARIKKANKILEELSKAAESKSQVPVLPPEQMSDTLRKSYEQHYLFQIDHNHRTFDWHLLSSKIIFYMVMFLVLSGITFSGLQFYKSVLEKKSRPKGALPPEADKPENSTIKASLQGIEVSSPVLGILILIISLLFFYLYLVYVYPVTMLK